MKEYIMNFSSYEPHSIHVISQILNNNTVSKVVFPALQNMTPSVNRFLQSPNDFSVDQIPSTFFATSLIRFPLFSVSGVELTFIIQFGESPIPSVINLSFNDKHLQGNVLNREILRNLFLEVIPIFKPGKAIITTDFTEHFPYFVGPNNKNYQMRVGWMTYFSRELVEYIGRDKFNSIQSMEAQELYLDGIFIQTSKTLETYEKHNTQLENDVIQTLELRRFLKTKL